MENTMIDTTPLAKHLKTKLGLQAAQLHWNLSAAALFEAAIQRQEAYVGDGGTLVAYTGNFTGRAPKDKFIVDDASSHDKVWWGEVNKGITEAHFDTLLQDMLQFLGDKELFVQDLLAGADPSSELPVRIMTQKAWHAQFAHNMFIRPQDIGRKLAVDEPQFTVLHTPDMQADPARHGTHSGTFVILNFSRRMVLIGGTHYAGEIKKSIFSVMNYLLPQQGIMSMHASANIGKQGDVAILFGLSGTGKTKSRHRPVCQY